MDEIAKLVRELGRQQRENAFYRICYGLLKRLQDTLGQASDDLLFLLLLAPATPYAKLRKN
ncbi:hypothetical protein N7490_006304 [Penicillium lividum]|nr:hypothetical protein N7490_006304 [Penicillium lividum]